MKPATRWVAHPYPTLTPHTPAGAPRCGEDRPSIRFTHLPSAVRIDDGLITGLYAVRNPEKLPHMEQETSLRR